MHNFIERLRNFNNKPLAFALIAVSIIFILSVLLSTVTFVVSTRVNANSNTIKNVEKQDFEQLKALGLGFCNRLQEVRTQANSNSRAIYTVLKLTALATNDAAKNTRGLTQKQRQLRKKFLKLYLDLANTRTTIRPTNCNEAINHPLTYKPPKPKLFPKVKLGVKKSG